MHLTGLRITARPGPFFYQRNPFKIQNKTLNIKRRSVYVHGWDGATVQNLESKW